MGRRFPGDLRRRGQEALTHRVSCAWAKFRALEETLLDKQVSIRLRLKLFDAVVTPALLYSLETCPLTENQRERLNAVQRRMLRRIVGWVCFEEETWEQRGHRMKLRLDNALRLYPIVNWSAQVQKRKQDLWRRVSSIDAPSFTAKAHLWSPVDCASLNRVEHDVLPWRDVGRPRLRWHDGIFQ